MSNAEDRRLAIHDLQRHDFESAKQSLQKYTVQNQQNMDLAKVPTDAGLFGWFDHKVTGDELNELTSQIQNHLINVNGISQGLVDELGQVYKALDALDNNYITAIIDSIKATEEVNRKTEGNQKDIQDTIKNQEKTIQVLSKHSKEIKDNQSGLEKAVKVLSQFSDKLSRLEHITDVDKAWELIEDLKRSVYSLAQYKDKLSKFKHLNEIDGLWDEKESAKKHFEGIDISIANITNFQIEFEHNIEGLSEFQQKLSAITHLADVDCVWSDTENLKNTVDGFNKTLLELSELVGSHSKAIKELTQAINEISRSQQKTFTSMSTALDKRQSALDEQVELLNISQREQLDIMKNSLAEANLALNNQMDSFKEFQQESVENLVQSLSEEKSALNKRLDAVTKRLKIAYAVAGGAAAIPIIHIVLSLLGVL